MPTFAPANKKQGAIAQLVEQRTENPCVPGSIPGGTTQDSEMLHYRAFRSFFVLVTIPNNHYESHYLNELKKGIKGRFSMNTQLTTP